MYQLVNMYQPVFRQQPKLLSATTLVLIIASVMFLSFAIVFNAHSTMQSLQRTSADLALNYTQLDARLDAVTSVDTLSTDASNFDEIALLRAQISDRSALLEQIDDLFIETEAGFGEVFETLARTNLPGLWLTGVQLDQDGSIEISGTTLDPKLVPRYLHLITRQSSLKNLNFGTVDLIRDNSNLPEINFVLSYERFGEE